MNELQPLTFSIASSRYSYAFLLFPVAWAVVAVGAVRTRAPDRGLLLLWALVFLVLALLQRRFNNSFAAPYALVWGGAVAHGLVLLRSRLSQRPRAAAALVVATSIALVVALFPSLRLYEVRFARSLAAFEEPEALLRSVQPRKRVQLGAAWWLARSTPATRGYLDPSLRPEYGILSSWDAGHLIRYVAQRPLVQDNFGIYGGEETFREAWSYYASTDEAEAVALLERLRVRYVVVERNGAGTDPDHYGPRSMTHRLIQHLGGAGSETDSETGEAIDVPALTRHRLVYHARSAPGAALRPERPHRAIAVYERVAGARVEGRGVPGAFVEAYLRVTTQAGPWLLPRSRETHLYRIRSRVDASGRYALTVPYPTDTPFSDAVRVAGRYELRSGGHRARLEVPEAAVQAGARVDGPVLAPSRPHGEEPAER